MVKARGGNTGPGNYRASKLGIGAEHLRQVIAGVPKIKHPNRAISTNEYKKSLKKEPESDV